ncbi:unnamed protein product [Auanema sp. JU1783]|nr:unnamed protein product [Auanema sp. JU1783]
MEGKVVIITGSTSGIGLQTAKDLRQLGATIIVTCRDEVRGRAAVEALQSMAECTGEVHMLSLDLMCYNSILEFCREVRETFEVIDVLICNAGIMGKAFELSSDGIESHMATNLFGHYVIINNLFDHLERTSGRILLVSSGLYKGATHMPLTKQLMGEDNWDYDGRFAYAFSKLAINLYTSEMARILKRTKSNVKVVCIRPGFVRGTELGRETHWVLRKAAAPLIWLFSKSLQDGTQSLVMASTAPSESLENGGMYHDGELEPFNEMVTEENAKTLFQMLQTMENLLIKRSKLPKDALDEASKFACKFV